MRYTKKDNADYALKLMLMNLLDVRAGRMSNKKLLAIIKLFED